MDAQGGDVLAQVLDLTELLRARRLDATFDRDPTPLHIVEAHRALQMGLGAAPDDEIRALYASGRGAMLEIELAVEVRAESGLVEHWLEQLRDVAAEDARHVDRAIADVDARATTITTLLELVAAGLAGTSARRAALSALVARADALDLRT